jgi:DNA topoisomerase VI subunit B
MNAPATKKPRANKHSLDREVFTISRELEYFSADELEKQTGYSRAEWWPGVIGKETIDNALDNCEQVGVSPEITVFFDGKKLEISDNGGGIPAEIVKRLTDFSTRTSDKLAYVSPTRGAQGNAWKTLLAMPYILDGERTCPVVIEACRVRHEIRIRTNQIARRPVVDHQQKPLSVQSGGTAIIFGRLQARLGDEDEEPQNVPKLVSDYALFNPHAAFRLNNYVFPARDPQWRKWLPRDPTPPHWYTLDRLEELVASMVSTGKARTVRDFLADFRGLTRTSTRMKVLAEANLERGTKLEDLVDKKRGAFDKKALGRLLIAMQQNSKEAAPEVLGVLGKQHFMEKLEDQSFRYAKQSGSENGLPYIVEAAFRFTDDELFRGLHVGLNWSVPLSNPLQDCALPGQSFAHGLEGFLQHHHVEVDQDPIALVLHITSPRFDFLDRGKGSVHLGPSIARAVADTVSKVVKEWASAKKARDRERRGEARRREEALRKGRPEEVTIIDAAFQVMAEAYRMAAGSTGIANARQVMYAARPYILKAPAGRSSTMSASRRSCCQGISVSIPKKPRVGMSSTMIAAT